MITIDASVWVAAADRRDEYHRASRDFVIEISARDLRILLPAIARIEIACALARRRRSATVGEKLTSALLEANHITEIPLDDSFADYAIKVGTQVLLRGADAQYLAVARLYEAELVTWDGELIQRAKAFTPYAWLEQNR